LSTLEELPPEKEEPVNFTQDFDLAPRQLVDLTFRLPKKFLCGKGAKLRGHSLVRSRVTRSFGKTKSPNFQKVTKTVPKQKNMYTKTPFLKTQQGFRT